MRYRRIRWLLALLLATIVCHAQTSIDLTENTDGTWTLNAMPAYDVMMEVEYEDDLSQATDLTDNGDGTWTLDQMPACNVKMVVEYEDVTPPSVTIAPVARTGLVFTGEAQELITAGEAEGGVMVYSLDGINFSETIPLATEVSLYTVYYKAKSNVPNCGDSYVQTLSVRIVANKTELNAIIEEAEAFYETIKNVPVTAATLLNTINAAISVQEDMNATQTEVDNAKETLSVALQAIQDKEIDLTDNGDGTWTLTAMPAWNVHIIVEYEDDLSQAIDLTDNGDGTWTLDQMPAYNVKLVVEYGDDETAIDNISASQDRKGDGYWYTLDGRRLAHQPITKGIYIYDGRKIVVK